VIQYFCLTNFLLDILCSSTKIFFIKKMDYIEFSLIVKYLSDVKDVKMIQVMI